jgi:hypothetical protein
MAALVNDGSSGGANHLIINTHGGVAKNSEGKSVGYLFSGERMSPDRNVTYESEMRAERDIYCTLHNKTYYGMTADFFSKWGGKPDPDYKDGHCTIRRFTGLPNGFGRIQRSEHDHRSGNG